MSRLETKFNELVVRTAVLEEMRGKYFAERLLRSWYEDFVDEDSGNIVPIQRNEILFNRGVLINDDVLSQLNFYLQSGDVQDVLVSNQKRSGISVKSSTSVYCATVYDCKKRNYYLYANSVDLALKIITDFLEQKVEGSFSVLGIKEVGYSNLIPLDEENDDDRDFYKVEIELAYEEDEPFKQVFILQASNAEEAKESIIKFVSLKMIEEKREKPFETTIVSAKTIPCNNIVDYHFVKEYFENV